MTKPISSATRAYHHGDLRNAMVEAAVAVARHHGPSAVVVRDIARQVGVSHNAGYRHFAGRDELLAAVAQIGLGELAERMRRGLESVPRRRDPAARARQRLRAIGRAYVQFALDEPGLFRSVWAASGSPEGHPGDEANPYTLLGSVLDEMVESGAIPPSRRPYGEVVAWSAVHGLATLLIDGPLTGLDPEEVDRSLDRLCDVVDAGL